jgi:hypothetical protein
MFLLRPNFTSARVSDASVPPKPQTEVERSAEAHAHDLFATQSSARRKTRCFSAHVVGAAARARSRGPCKRADRSACEDDFAHDAHVRVLLFHDSQPNSNGMDEAVFLRSTVRTQDALSKPHHFISPHTRVRKRRWHPFLARARRAPVFIWDPAPSI